MSLEAYDLAVNSILCNSQMSCSATLTYETTGYAQESVTINGMFVTGTASDDTPSSNAPKRGVRWDSFRVSRTQLFTLGITAPARQLRKAHLVVRGLHYGVLEVRGAENELLTLTLRPENEPNAEEDC